MGVVFTKEQQRVIDARDCNVLVAAAAGSGKTAVLVERIIQLITDKEHPIDIDRILVVTFTKAAAAQMRERIYEAIEQRLEQSQEDENLIRQMNLIHTAMIMTIDSFCVFLLRNHFNEIGLDPAFRIADEGELSLLSAEVMDALMEEAYESSDEKIQACIEYFNRGVLDEKLQERIKKLHAFSQSHPWPNQWLEACINEYAVSDDKGLEELEFVKAILAITKQYLEEGLRIVDKATQTASMPGGPAQYLKNLEEDAKLFEALLEITSFEKMSAKVAEATFGRLSGKKDDTVDPSLQKAVKDMRDEAKDCLTSCKELFYFHSAQRECELLNQTMPVIEGFVQLTKEYAERFLKAKLDKNMIDFSDEVHFALQILVDENGNPTPIAQAYQSYFDQIMIDEYQDSNLVQEILLSSIARETEKMGNRFMVGDIKQSIYRFRMANPELFLEKYNTYPVSDGEKNLRIDLNQNFRSRKQVLDSANEVFARIMTEPVGGVIYDEDAALKLGADYPDCENSFYETEYLLYERDGNEDYLKAEAELVARKIISLLENGKVKDEEGGLRQVRLSDIVILVRSTKEITNVWRQVFASYGIASRADSRTGYFDVDEIKTVMSFLKVIENPYDDISLASVMTSVFGACNNEELAKLRTIDQEKEEKLYDTLQKSDLPKHQALYEKIVHYRALSDYMGIYELLSEILENYDYLAYVRALPGGAQKSANVEMLLTKAIDFEKTSYHGLYSFVHYVQKLHEYEVEMGQADASLEAEDAVSIMTIHASKGLEFPIVFVSQVHKRFNRKDQQDILGYDITYGLSVDYLNKEKHYKEKTMRKQFFAMKEKLAMIGEELRILYVAFTRAKEKLIVTGCIKDYEKAMEKFSGISEDSVPFVKIISCLSYLDLLMYALGDKLDAFQVFHAEDLEEEKFAENMRMSVRRQMLVDCLEKQEASELTEAIIEKFENVYPYTHLEKLYAKTSVSELKKEHIHADDQTNVVFETDRVELPYLPAFMKEEEKSSGVQRGSAYHRLLELIDYKTLFQKCYGEKETYQKPDVNTIRAFTQDEFARIDGSKKMAEDIGLVKREKIEQFLSCESAYRMAKAASKGMLYLEQPFVMAVSADRVHPDISSQEKVLIQGIIDVFFCEDMPDGTRRVTVLDYKTDRVSEAEELVRRYQLQLDYYAEALGKLMQYNVGQRIIYSFALEEEIIF